MGAVLGLIAGRGRFPLDVARGARRGGREVVAIAFPGQTDAGIADVADPVHWLEPGQVDVAVDVLLAAGAREAILAGKVPKLALLEDPDSLALDARARELLRGLADRRDHSILRGVAAHLGKRGITLLPQIEFTPELLVGAGPLGRVSPSEAAIADIAFGWPLAQTVAGRDIGQTVVVKDRAVLAVEAIDGTDATIRRAGQLAPGACVIKVARSDQDPRFDLPALGPDTLDAVLDARASVLAFEAGRTVVLDRETLAERADEQGIAIVGVAGDGEVSA